MKPTKPTIPYRFTSAQRKGILALITLIVITQLGWLLYSKYMFSYSVVNRGENEWLAHQQELDALKAKTDSTSHKIYPFNPNFISDYKAYTLGLTTQQADKIKAFRKEGKWINSAQDFKAVTGVSDSLLTVLSPYFKFPDWVKNKSGIASGSTTSHKDKFDQKNNAFVTKTSAISKSDINSATEEELEKAYGIGPAFARKIVKKRTDLGAFVSMEQMDEFEGFSPEAITDLKKRFSVVGSPLVNRINVNTASLAQLTRFPYFNRDIAKGIITRRSMDGKISNFEELSKIQPEIFVKLKNIHLYLEY
nr:helix-hairpin-helix domain-containing protein [uncultured Flavobacterium sp.]